MTIQKRKLFSLFVFAVVFLTAGFLFACKQKKETVVTFSGNGTVSSQTLEDGCKAYTATPDEYNDFLGWYDGQSLYSNSATIIIDQNTPEKINAVFGSNAEISLQRFLSATNNLDLNQEKKYLNFSINFDVEKIEV